MKKKLQGKLKLTKSTIANLDRIKGGRPPCACNATVTDGAINRDNQTIVKTYCLTYCPTVCPTCGGGVDPNCN